MAISFSVEPFEAQKVIYQRVAPAKQGAASVGMLYFYVDIKNTGGPVTLTKIDVSFPGGSQPAASFTRNQAVGASRREWLTKSEALKLTASPARVKISLFFEGVASPVTNEWELAPHQVSYQFFARPEKIEEYGEYITLNGGHVGESGSQQFAQDAGAVGWRDGKLSSSKTGSNENKDRFLFGRPFYAMGDGLVLAADDSNEDNPAPGKRAINRMPGTYQGKEKVRDLAVACLRRAIPDKADSNRILLASVNEGNTLKLTALEQTDLAGSITLLKEVAGPKAEAVEMVSLNERHAVTGTRVGSKWRVTLWELTLDAGVVERDHVEIAQASALKLLALSSTQLVTAARGADGMLTLSAWGREGNAWKHEPLDSHKIGPVGVFDLVAFNQGRFSTAVQTQEGSLKVIAWELAANGGGGGSDGSSFTTYVFERGAEGTGGAVTEIAAVDLADVNKFGTAVRQQDGTMKFIVWDASEGKVTRKQEYTREAPASMLEASPFKGESVALLSRTDAGKMHLTSLDVELDDQTSAIKISVLSDENETGGTTDLFRSATMPTPQPTLVTAVRTAEGLAKVILWQYSYSNFIKVLYGNEIVTCVHLMQGSIPDKLIPKNAPVAVSVGEMIGRMGHSGKSSGPHLHIQADRVKPELLGDLPKLMALIKAGATVSVIRPMQFHGAKAMQTSVGVKPGGAAANPLAELDGHGVFFEGYVLLPEAP